jgi:DNA invertase Pin-like site-specific DNA recombinase
MFSVIASVPEYETEVRRERQLAGIAAAKEKSVSDSLVPWFR